MAFKPEVLEFRLKNKSCRSWLSYGGRYSDIFHSDAPKSRKTLKPPNRKRKWSKLDQIAPILTTNFRSGVGINGEEKLEELQNIFEMDKKNSTQIEEYAQKRRKCHRYHIKSVLN